MAVSIQQSYLLRLLISVAIFAVTSTAAQAQSIGRIPEKTSSDIQAPNIEDYAAYIKSMEAEAASRVTDSQAGQRRSETISSIKSLLNRKNNKATKAKLMLRLAQLYRENGDASRDADWQAYSAAYAQWQMQDELGEAPKFESKTAANFYKESVATYKSLFDQFPLFSKNAEVKLELALLLARVGDQSAESWFEQVIREQPASAAGARATLGLAECKFDRRDYDTAQRLYLKAAKSKDHKDKRDKTISYYALYKLGWIDALKASAKKDNKARQRAEKRFKNLAAQPRSRRPISNLAMENVHLRLEAKRDLAYLWSNAGTASAAKNYFDDSKDTESYAATLERMAWLKLQAKDYAGAVKGYQQAIAAAPLRAANQRIRMSIIRTQRDSNDQKGLVQSFQDMSKAYAPDVEGNWYAANVAPAGKNPTTKGFGFDAASARLRFRATLAVFASRYYQLSQPAKKPIDRVALETSIALLGLYVELFPTGDQSYNLRYSYAEALRLSGRKEPAARQYFIVAKADNLKAKWRPQSATQALTLQKEVVAAASFKPVPPIGKVQSPLVVPPTKAFLVEVIDTFVGFYPKDARSQGIRSEAALIQLQYGHYDDAVRRYDGVALAAPASPEAKAAVHVVLDLYQTRQDWPQLISWSRKFQARRDLVDAKLLPFVRASLRTGMWQLAESYVREKKPIPAAIAFIEFQREFPQDVDADKALSKASELYFQEGKGAEGVAAAVALVNSYNKSPLRPDTLLRIAQVKASLLDFEGAALTEVIFANDYAADPRASGVLYKAAGHFQAAENKDAYAQKLGEIGRRFATSNIAPTAAFEYAQARQDLGQLEEALRGFKLYLTLYGAKADERALSAEAHAAVLAATITPKVAATALPPIETKLLRLAANQGKEARHILADYLFENANEAKDQRPEMRVDYFNFERFEKSMKVLTKSIDDFDLAYKRIAALGDPEFAVGAHYQFGLICEEGMKSMEGEPDTEALMIDDVKKIRAMKQAQEPALKARMIAAWEQSLAVSKKFSWSGSWQRLALHRMDVLQPNRYQELMEMQMRPDTTTHESTHPDVVQVLQD